MIDIALCFKATSMCISATRFLQGLSTDQKVDLTIESIEDFKSNVSHHMNILNGKLDAIKDNSLFTALELVKKMTIVRGENVEIYCREAHFEFIKAVQYYSEYQSVLCDSFIQFEIYAFPLKFSSAMYGAGSLVDVYENLGLQRVHSKEDEEAIAKHILNEGSKWSIANYGVALCEFMQKDYTNCFYTLETFIKVFLKAFAMQEKYRVGLPFWGNYSQLYLPIMQSMKLCAELMQESNIDTKYYDLAKKVLLEYFCCTEELKNTYAEL